MKKQIRLLLTAVSPVALYCALSFVPVSLNTVHAALVDLPQTSQITCYDAAGTVIDCPGTGQDGDIRAGLPWPQPRFTDNNDGTLTDNLTGLVWLQNANCNGYAYWADALTWANTLASGACGLTDGSVAGDWRLPNILELESLVNVDHANESCGGSPCASPAAWLTAQGFTSMGASSYFSSSTAIQDGHRADAWSVDMGSGNLSHTAKTSNPLVLAVRGTSTGPAKVWRTGQTACYNSSGSLIDCTGTGQDADILAGTAWPVQRFTDNVDGTVTDNLSGLTWLQNANCANGTMNWPPGTRDWPTALADVADLNATGTMNGNECGDTSNGGAHQTDWRLPNFKELLSLIDFGRYNLALPASHPFTGVIDYDYWTSTTGVRNLATAWEVAMWDGYTQATSKSATSNYVWPVRGGILPPPPPFPGGTGTAADPYQIATPEQLDAVRDYLANHFILTADLNLDVAPYNEGEGWQPIGTYGGTGDPANVPFTGSLDGNGHTIGGLFINRPALDNTGLFGYGQGADFADLTLQVNIIGKSQVGGLVGRLEPGTISRVAVSGTVQGMYTEVGGLVGYIRETAIDQASAAVAVTAGTAHVGGLVGNAQNGSSITYCHATGSVSSTSNYAVGGLAGTFWGSTLEDSYATGNVSGKDSVGGLAGYYGSGSITRCYATGNVTATPDGTVNFGGLAGNAQNGATITDSFATGDVYGVNLVGGLVGYSITTGAITNTFATGRVSGTSDLGGLIGKNLSAPITASYYNSETSGQSDTGKGEPRTTAQMRAGMAYVPAETYVGWFAGTPAWGIGKGFHGGYLLNLPRFTVAAAITGQGTVQWTGEYPHGAAADLLLVPGRGYSIGTAQGCGGSLTGDLYSIDTVTADCTVTVAFAKQFPWILFMPRNSR
ncbi:MAG: Lcl domain-containing protein [Desulfobulbaceae bacterium]